MEKIKETLISLKKLDDKYFKKFNECYPLCFSEEKAGVFGPNELYEMAIEAQVLLAMLGDTAMKRMDYIGFNILYPFSNPVDWYSWKENIKKRKVPQSIYFSIGVRMEAEFDRMGKFIEKDAWKEYSMLSSFDFSVSCGRYLEHFEEYPQEKEAEFVADVAEKRSLSPIHIENFNYSHALESEAISNLDRLHKGTGIWSNIAVASKIFGA